MGVRGGNLLMMAMPHHLDTQLQGAGMGNVYRTTYGFLTGKAPSNQLFRNPERVIVSKIRIVF